MVKIFALGGTIGIPRKSSSPSTWFRGKYPVVVCFFVIERASPVVSISVSWSDSISQALPGLSTALRDNVEGLETHTGDTYSSLTAWGRLEVVFLQDLGCGKIDAGDSLAAPLAAPDPKRA
ncbi:hypothetical protein B0H17DRAFT_1145822 [Mycena rosella]|uniref:Uncharacterized protein n=1 Tax=Mycena rosella TaxID=1033263 RepID=A0AAD7CQ18_MYCRO|nr:hypothetical protein B0H17DRAFT_1145822 [Mycena rosella]